MTAQKLSRLELCIEILNAIENQVDSKFNDLKEKTHVDKKSIIYAIEFLEEQGLIESEIVERNGL
jgi:DNA-binding PadR family transcriptional regulator